MSITSHSPATVTAVTDATFASVVLASDTPVLVDFTATWCPPCRMIAPVLQELAAEYAGRLAFVELDVDENPATAAAYGVLGMPTLMVFRDGIMVFRQAGALPAPALEELITAVKGLDMDDVRAQVAAAEGKQG